MCLDTFYNSLRLYVGNMYSKPQKEVFREFDIYFLIENNNYQQMHYITSVKTLWNTTCVFLFFTKQQVSIIQNKKKTYVLRNVGLLS